MVDLASRREVRRLPLPVPASSHPYSIAVSANGTALVSVIPPASAPTNLFQLDLATGIYRQRPEWSTYGIARLRASADRSRIAITTRQNGGGSVAFYSAGTEEFTTRSVYGTMEFHAVDGSGSRIVTGPSSAIYDRSLVLRATMPGNDAKAAAMNRSGSRAYMLKDDRVEVLDADRGLVVASLALPETVAPMLGALTLTPDDTTLVALTGKGFTVVPVAGAAAVPCPTPTVAPGVVGVCGAPLADLVTDDRGRAYATNPARNQVEVVSLSSRALEAPIAVGSGPTGIALSPDGNTLYTANAGGEDISVVDLNLRREVRRIERRALPRPRPSLLGGDGRQRQRPGDHPRRHVPHRQAPSPVGPAAGGGAERTDGPPGKPSYLKASGDHSRIGTIGSGGAVSLYVSATDRFTGKGGDREPVIDLPRRHRVEGAGGRGRDQPVSTTAVLDGDLVRRASIPNPGFGAVVDSQGATAYRIMGWGADIRGSGPQPDDRLDPAA